MDFSNTNKREVIEH